jgi:hypothetical protein
MHILFRFPIPKSTRHVVMRLRGHYAVLKSTCFVEQSVTSDSKVTYARSLMEVFGINQARTGCSYGTVTKIF